MSGISQLEYVGNFAFWETAWYDNLPGGILYLGKVLYGYKGNIPEGDVINVTEGTVMITEYAFIDTGSGANNFTLNIPKSVTYIQYNDNGRGMCGLGCCPKSITVASDNPVYNSRDGSCAIIETATNTLLSASQSTATIPWGVETIWDNAFMYYNGSNVTIPNSVKRIGHYAFYNSSIKTVSLGNGVKEIGHAPFLGCFNLENISVSTSNSYYDSRNDCNAIIEKSTDKLIVGCKNTVIPEAIKIIGENAFRTSNRGLFSITIPDNVEEIGEYAFSEQYDLENITFGRKVQKIGSSVVDRRKLRYIRVLNSAPCEISSYSFNSSICEEVPLYVPQGSLVSYMVADNWSKFKTIKEGEPPVLVSAITLNNTELALTLGGTQQLTATTAPDNATDKTVTWSSSNDEIFTVDSNGLVTAVAKGTATITCKANDESGVTATCKVTVNNLSPTAVALPNTATVAIGSSIALKPEFTPSNALAELTWSSDDESIAVVSNNGVVTGKKKGQTFINVETDNGKTAYCKLTVTAPEPVSIELPKTATVIVGGT